MLAKLLWSASMPLTDVGEMMYHRDTMGLYLAIKQEAFVGEMGATGGHCIKGNEPYSERYISYIFILVCEC